MITQLANELERRVDSVWDQNPALYKQNYCNNVAIIENDKISIEKSVAGV